MFRDNETDTATESPTIAQLAREACEKTRELTREEQIQKAHKMVRKQVDADDELREAIIEQAIDTAILDAIYHVRAGFQAELKYDKPFPKLPNPDSRTPEVLAARSRVCRAWLDEWQMPDGRVLGDFTGDELQPEIERLAATARDAVRQRRYFRELAALAGSKKVRDVVSSTKAKELWEKAKHGK